MRKAEQATRRINDKYIPIILEMERKKEEARQSVL